jgi:hypothetical protein
MPLSAAAPRQHLHTRDITVCGYHRDDGLVDIEAHMTDTKTHDGTHDDGSLRPAGEPLHDMWLRMTLTPDREIIACEAAMDATPYRICPGVAPNFSALAGLRIEGGFIRRAMERVGGAAGCTHLRELLQQMGTVAFQTLYSLGTARDDPDFIAGRRPPLLNSCYAWGETGAMIQQRFPAWYTPSQSAEPAPLEVDPA